MGFSSFALYFDDVEVGQEWTSNGRTVTEADIVNFAGVSGDFNPIHMDHEFAESTPYRKPIAHGLLILSMGSGLGVSCPPMRTVAFLQIRELTFKEPAFIGDTIRLKSRVLEKTIRGRGRRGEIVWYRGVINQEGRIIQEGTFVSLVESRAMRRTPDIAPQAAEPSAVVG